MLEPSFFHNVLQEHDVNFFAGVPDSLLKNFCAYISDTLPSEKHIIAANEGGAVGLGIGYHLATNKIPLIYMQNSGLGNVVNPLLSMADSEVCSVPMLLMIGWRGEPGVKDEPQHIKQGRVMLAMLDAMEIPYLIVEDEEEAVQSQISQAMAYVTENSAPYALIVRKNTFNKYDYQGAEGQSSLMREDAVETISQFFTDNTVFIATTGMTARELFEVREKAGSPHKQDFLVIGAMGHASQIALGTSLSAPTKKVICLDGDGALLMHMGSLGLNGTYGQDNLIHIVLNNGAHESVGAQKTITPHLCLTDLATACGYPSVQQASTAEGLKAALAEIKNTKGPHFIEVSTACGHRKDLGRPTIGPVENKNSVQEYTKTID